MLTGGGIFSLAGHNERFNPSVFLFRGRDDGSWLISGAMPADEMAERLHILIPRTRAYHTAAGFALDGLGHLPNVGESFDASGWRFEVVDLDGKRIDKVLATPISARRLRSRLP